MAAPDHPAHALPVRIGHFTGDGTGVTVILLPEGTTGSGEVRGGAPATREFDLLDPVRLVNRVDAVVLSGGSAFGLSAADGVMRYLRERGVGHPTPHGPVPIVVGMSIFDASVAGQPPGAEAGYAAAADAATPTAPATGVVGAGTGAASGKWRGRPDPGGCGWWARSCGDALVAALVVVNAWGHVLEANGRPAYPAERLIRPADPEPMLNTTIAVVMTDAKLSKSENLLMAQSGHDGFARALHPPHSRYDGDAVVAVATGKVSADLDQLRATAIEVTADAIRSAVRRSS